MSAAPTSGAKEKQLAFALSPHAGERTLRIPASTRHTIYRTYRDRFGGVVHEVWMKMNAGVWSSFLWAGTFALGLSACASPPGGDPAGSGGHTSPGPAVEGPMPGPEAGSSGSIGRDATLPDAEESGPGVGPTETTTSTAAELVASWDLGWNLGNSLDAPEGETAWGNPMAHADLWRAVRAAGFDVVRIPVTWSLHTGSAPEFTVDPTWMARVNAVVDEALDAGFYVIINLHHDGADGYDGVEWLSLNDGQGQVTDANNAEVTARFVKIWAQISEQFGKYGERVLFESLNEIHDGYGPPVAAYHTIINALNQAFVDTVRGADGNNSVRHLVVPGYNTNIEHTASGFVAPVDPTENHLILSAHYYDPYSFALEASTQTWGAGAQGADDWGQEAHVTAQLDLLKSTATAQGLPAILGEYGAVHQSGFEEYRRYYLEYVTKAAKLRGIVPFYWDNGAQTSGADGFGLFNRTTGAVTRPTIVDAMLRAASGNGTLLEIPPAAP